MSPWPPAQPERRRRRLAPPLEFPEPGAAAYGAAPPASRLLRIGKPTALRAGLDPGDHCGP